MSRAGEIPLEPPLVRAPTTVPAAEDRSYLGFVAGALVSALAGGFLLAVWMPLAATDVVPGIERAPRLVQAHGWLQLQGWGGLFVAGMALRLVPRFVGRRRLPKRVTLPLLAVLAGATLLRGAVPWLDGRGAEAAALGAGAAMAVGAAGTSGVLGWTLWRGRRGGEAWRWFLAAGAGWWLAWAGLAVWAGFEAAERGGLAPAAFDDAMAWAVMLGAIGNFLVGIQSRAVPVFFGRKPPGPGRLLGPFVLLNGGALAMVGAMAAEGEAAARLEGAGLLVGGAALAWSLPIAGAIRGRATRLRPRARAAARYVVAANVAGVGAGLLMAAAGAAMLAEGDFAAAPLRDTGRHLFGLGPITLLILGMARLMAPVFAVERTEGRAPGVLEQAPFWLLLGALVLRAGAGLASGSVSYTAWMHTAATAGVLGWLAIALFAVSVARAARNEGGNLRALKERAWSGTGRTGPQ